MKKKKKKYRDALTGIVVVALILSSIGFLVYHLTKNNPSKEYGTVVIEQVDELGEDKPDETAPTPQEAPTPSSVSIDYLQIDVLSHEVFDDYEIGFGERMTPQKGKYAVIKLNIKADKRLTQVSIKDWVLKTGDVEHRPDETATNKANQFPLTMIERNIPFELNLVYDLSAEEASMTPKTITFISTANNVEETLALP